MEQPVQTLVVVDLEATGLAADKPKVTELCFVAVHRNELITSSGNPRILNKLQLCVNPQKLITPESSKLTGLYNDELESQLPFDHNLVQLMNSFLDRLPQPICLLAHNGHHYDFPLLKAQLNEIHCKLKDALLCCDSLITLRDLNGEQPYEKHLRFISNGRSSNESPAIAVSTSDPRINQEAVTNAQAHVDVHIDENSNLSARVLPNQNIHNNNVCMVNNNSNDESVVAELRSTPPDADLNGEVHMRDLSPPRVEEQPILQENGSPVNMDELVDINLDPLHFQYSNERTPPNKPPITNIMPRKVIPPICYNKVDVENTKRQLDFESPEDTFPKPPPVRKLNGAREGTVDFGTTKRRLSFDFGESRDPISDTPKSQESESNNDQDTLVTKRVCFEGDLGASFSSAMNAIQPLHVDTSCENVKSFPQSSLEDSDFLFAVENTENNMVDFESKCNVTSPGDRKIKSTNLKGNCVSQTLNTTVYANSNTLKNQQPNTGISSHTQPNKATLSYSLPNIYERTFGCPPNISHTAEDDCMALLKLIKYYSPRFIHWVDSYCLPFSEVQDMY